MIYMGGDLQKKRIPLFHYALNPGGALFLGTSETVGEFADPESYRDQSLTTVKQLARAEVLEPYRLQRIAKDGRMVDVWLTATALVNATGEAYVVVTTERTRRELDEHEA